MEIVAQRNLVMASHAVQVRAKNRLLLFLPRMRLRYDFKLEHFSLDRRAKTALQQLAIFADIFLPSAASNPSNLSC